MKRIFFLFIFCLTTVFAQTANDFLITGSQYSDFQNYEKAIEFYSKAIELNPLLTDAYFNRGIAFYFENKCEDAIEIIQKYWN